MPIFFYKDLSAILKQTEKKHPFPIYLIAGDPFLVNDLHQKMIDLFLSSEQQTFNLEIVDGEKEDIISILDRIQTFPFFPGRKVVSVRNPVQIFSSGREDRLLKKAEEAWQKGQAERSARLLRTLFQNAGISQELLEGGVKGREEVLQEKLFPGNGELPNWFKEVLPLIENQVSAETESQNPDEILESALRTGFPKDHILILLMEEPPGLKKIVKSIAEYGAVINLAIKHGKKGEQTATLKEFLKTRLRQEGKTIMPQAEALLLERVGPEAFLLEMEIQKLVAYCGDRKQIQPKDITEIVGAFREEPLYELTTVLGERKLEEGLQKLNQLWDQGYNPLQILAGITNTLRRLLVARDLLEMIPEFSSRVWQDFGAFSTRILPQVKQAPLPELLSKAHPFVLFNTLKTAQSFSRPHLVLALEALHEVDRLLKTSGATPTFLLEDFIISFCKTKAIS
jgi:DNA polymerase III subunit delta